jgi:hypothetical protein
MASRAARSCVALGIAAALLLQAGPAASPASAGTEAVPDLAVAPLTGFQIQSIGGQRLLRFSATMVNPGAGPFELRGSRGNASEPGLPSGSYTVRARVDPNGFFLESNEVNQCAFATVSLSTASDAVTVTQTGDVCVNDWSESQFAGDIEWAFATGITLGCGSDLFCTNNGVTREQMASFLTRALALPPTGTDFFTDDEGSIHEDDINRIAAAGITVGCPAAAFCPHAGLNREQMASFLVRAFVLPTTDGDFFTDDEASAHEGDINAVAAAGVTTGCGGGQFCPTATVTRGQMAAFLHRAVG